MRLAKTAAFVAVAASLPVLELAAGEEVTRKTTVSDTAVTSATVQFITQHHKSPANERPRLSFDTPDIQPQDETGKYAVFGGYMAFGGSSPTPHAYGLTMRLTCARHEDLACWRLEKLLIDQNLLVDK